MALEIIESCVSCQACLPWCPNDAIIDTRPHFLIEAARCTECIEAYDTPQCAAICPVEGAIIDELGVALNPPGTLTGIAARPTPSASRAGA